MSGFPRCPECGKPGVPDRVQVTGSETVVTYTCANLHRWAMAQEPPTVPA